MKNRFYKKQLVKAIQRLGEPDYDWPSDWNKSQTVAKSLLYAHMEKICPQPKYQVKAIVEIFSTETFRTKIRFLPVAFPELSPIEMVWSDIKGHVWRPNFSFQSDHLEEIARECVSEFGHIMFCKYCTHVYKEEEKYIAMYSSDENSAKEGATATTDTSSGASDQGVDENFDRTVADSK